jgi:hypothetical protein
MLPSPSTSRRGFLKTFAGAVAAAVAPPVIQAAAPAAAVEVASVATAPLLTSWSSHIDKITGMMIREIRFDEDLTFIKTMHRLQGLPPMTEKEELKIRAAFQEETDRLDSLPIDGFPV